MTQQHPITPPPELYQQWMQEFTDPQNFHWTEYETGIATRAAQWGADMELEACLERILDIREADALRDARRPKTPSLKERIKQAISGGDTVLALELLEGLDDSV